MGAIDREQEHQERQKVLRRAERLQQALMEEIAEARAMDRLRREYFANLINPSPSQTPSQHSDKE